MARIAYGIHGYGHGAVARSLAILDELKTCELLVFCGGDAYAYLKGRGFETVEVPSLEYEYDGSTQTISRLGTIKRNCWPVLDLLFYGRLCRSVAGMIRVFDPDVIISDSEMFTQRVANRSRIPLINLDHFSILAYCDWNMPLHYRIRKLAVGLAYRLLMGRALKIIATAFYPVTTRNARVQVVGPILRQSVREKSPEEGDHLVVYLNRGENRQSHVLARCLAAHQGEVRVYGLGPRPTRGNVHYYPIGERFIDDIATCRAVISTGGNQLIGELLRFRKPVYVIPENSTEQQLNSLEVERMGIGMCDRFRDLSRERFEEFIDRTAEFRENFPTCGQSSTDEVVTTIFEFLDGVADGRRTQASQ